MYYLRENCGPLRVRTLITVFWQLTVATTRRIHRAKG